MQTSDVRVPLPVRVISQAFEALGCEIEINSTDDSKKVEINVCLPSSGRYEHAFLNLDLASMDGSVHAELELYAFWDFSLSDPQLFEQLERLVVDRLR